MMEGIVGQKTFNHIYPVCFKVKSWQLEKKVHMSNNIRIEEDLLGTGKFQLEAYYGVHTLSDENFYVLNNKISDIPQFVRMAWLW